MKFSGSHAVVRVTKRSHTPFTQFPPIVSCYLVTKSSPTLYNPMTAAHQAPLFFTISRSLLDSCPLSQWCYPIISSSVTPFSSCPQSFPESESFPVSRLFTSGGQSTGASALASVLPINIEDWFPLGWTGWISLQSKGLSRVFSNTTVQKHQFFSAQLSLWSNSHIPMWLLVKP